MTFPAETDLTAETAMPATHPWIVFALSLLVLLVGTSVVCLKEFRGREAAEQACQRAQLSQVRSFQAAVAPSTPDDSATQTHLGCSTESDPQLVVSYPDGATLSQARAAFAAHGWTRELPGYRGTRISPTGDLYANFTTAPIPASSVVVYVQQTDFTLADD